MKVNKVKIKMPQFITPKICLWVGMASLFHIGCISFMGLAFNTNVKYVEIIAIGAVEHLRCISNNGDIHMVWNV